MTINIPLTQGKTAMIDDADLDIISPYKWYAMQVKNRFYAAAHIRYGKHHYRMILMHRLIMGASTGQQVDHINMDTLDCRRSNLRFCTNAQNQRNRAKHHDNTSGYKGVDWMKSRQKWRARIMIDRKEIHLGLFDDPIKAAEAYDKAAIEHHKSFARLNFTQIRPDEE